MTATGHLRRGPATSRKDSRVQMVAGDHFSRKLVTRLELLEQSPDLRTNLGGE